MYVWMCSCVCEWYVCVCLCAVCMYLCLSWILLLLMEVIKDIKSIFFGTGGTDVLCSGSRIHNFQCQSFIKSFSIISEVFGKSCHVMSSVSCCLVLCFVIPAFFCLLSLKQSRQRSQMFREGWSADAHEDAICSVYLVVRDFTSLTFKFFSRWNEGPICASLHPKIVYNLRRIKVTLAEFHDYKSV